MHACTQTATYAWTRKCVLYTVLFLAGCDKLLSYCILMSSRSIARPPEKKGVIVIQRGGELKITKANKMHGEPHG